MSKLTTDILKKYGITYWDPCNETCVNGKCNDANSVGCCPVIRTTKLNFVPTPIANSIRSEFVTGSDNNVYYIDKAGTAILLEKDTVINNLVSGHAIGNYINERGTTFSINETITYIGEMTLNGTVLHIPFVNEAGIVEDNQVNLQSLIVNPPAQTPILAVDSYSIDMTASGPYNTHIKGDIILDQISGGGNNAATITVNGLYVDPLTGGGGSSYSSTNGITTSSYVHRLGGNLVNDTILNSQNINYLHVDNAYRFKVENNISTLNLTKFSVDSTDGENNIWSLTDVANQIKGYVHLNSLYNTKVGAANLTSQDISELVLSQGTQAQLYTASGSNSSWFQCLANKAYIVAQPGPVNVMSPVAKLLGVTTSKHYQKNMTIAYSNHVVTTQGNTGVSENNITRCLTGASLGTIGYPTANTTSTIETGVIMFSNTTPVTNTLPTASLMPNKVLEIRAFGTSTVTLSPAPKLNTTGATLSTLQPIGSNDYANPTYVKIISNGTDWLVINQW